MPPLVLQIHREAVKPGCEAEYAAIEDETCRQCAALGCPHPFLGAELMTGPMEVWFFNGYESSAEQQQVADDYARNAALIDMLMNQNQRKSALTNTPVECVATHRPEASRGEPWSLGSGRLVVITIGRAPTAPGTVFEASDGTWLVVRAAHDRNQADRIAAAAGPGTVVCAVRPRWSCPAPEWVAADPAFWQPANHLR